MSQTIVDLQKRHQLKSPEDINLKHLATMKPGQQVKTMLEAHRSSIAAAMPKHMPVDRLIKTAITAVTKTPKLLECYMPTLLGSVIQATQMGLEPNTALGHAYLVPFKNRKQERTDCQLIIGYKGLIDLARRSGNIISIAAHEVCEQDYFEWEYGIDEKLSHRPAPGDRGEVIYFYAIAHMKDGGHAFEVMSRQDVEIVMRSSQSGGRYGPWKDHFIPMGRKTVVRSLAKWLPLSIEVATAVAMDEVADTGGDQNMGSVLEGEWSAIESHDEGEAGAPEPRETRAPAQERPAATTAAQRAPTTASVIPPEELTYPERVGPGKFDWVDRDGINYGAAVESDGSFLFGYSKQNNMPSHTDGSFRAARGRQEQAEAYRRRVIQAKAQGQGNAPEPEPAEPEGPADDTNVTSDADTDAWRKDYGQAGGDNQAPPVGQKSADDDWDMPPLD